MAEGGGARKGHPTPHDWWNAICTMCWMNGSTSESEPPMNCGKRRNDLKTKRLSLPWEKSERSPCTARTATGIEVA